MFRRAERPRVAALKAGLAAFVVVIVVAAGGGVVGKASVEDGVTPAQLHRAAASAAGAKRELAAIRSSLGAQVDELEQSKMRWRARARRAEALTERWRLRAQRAERRLGGP